MGPDPNTPRSASGVAVAPVNADLVAISAAAAFAKTIYREIALPSAEASGAGATSPRGDWFTVLSGPEEIERLELKVRHGSTEGSAETELSAPYQDVARHSICAIKIRSAAHKALPLFRGRICF